MRQENFANKLKTSVYDRDIVDEMLKKMLLTQRVWQMSWFNWCYYCCKFERLVDVWKLVKVIWLLMI